MRLPKGEAAIVPADKLSRYLLSLDHPVGHPKAAFFRGLGFNDSNVHQLAESLSNIARTADVRDTIDTGYGVKYVITGKLTGPSGKRAWVRTVWIVDKGETVPRFVTAYPSGEEDQNNDS